MSEQQKTRVLVRDEKGNLTEHFVVEKPRTYLIRIDGAAYNHVADAEDGTWIYKKGG